MFLQSLPEFLDIARYVLEVSDGGTKRAAELRPSDEQLLISDDTQNLDHRRILELCASNDRS